MTDRSTGASAVPPGGVPPPAALGEASDGDATAATTTDGIEVAPDAGLPVSPRQIGGFVVIAAAVLAFGRWLRRPRGRV